MLLQIRRLCDIINQVADMDRLLPQKAKRAVIYTEKYLIINADDFGMCHSVNLAVEALFGMGAITSSTIMAPCAWAKEAAVWAAAHPAYAVGAHLTFTSEWENYRWAPVCSGKTNSLRDEEGFMWHGAGQLEAHCDLKEVENEIRAQVERIRNLGVPLSHLDNHMGSLYGIETGRFEILRKTLAICGEYGLPFRFPGTFIPEMLRNDMLNIRIDADTVAAVFDGITEYAGSLGVTMPDYLIPGDWNGPQDESYENFRDYLYDLYAHFPEGITETYIHPALESEELKGITGCWHRRVWEYRLFSDPKTGQHIRDCGIQLINYRDLAAMRKKKIP